jgi:hypothetical protein
MVLTEPILFTGPPHSIFVIVSLLVCLVWSIFSNVHRGREFPPEFSLGFFLQAKRRSLTGSEFYDRRGAETRKVYIEGRLHTRHPLQAVCGSASDSSKALRPACIMPKTGPRRRIHGRTRHHLWCFHKCHETRRRKLSKRLAGTLGGWETTQSRETSTPNVSMLRASQTCTEKEHRRIMWSLSLSAPPQISQPPSSTTFFTSKLARYWMRFWTSSQA